MEIPSSAAGVVKEMQVKLGDKVSEGSLLLVLEGDGAASAPRHRAGAAPPQPRRRAPRRPRRAPARRAGAGASGRRERRRLRPAARRNRRPRHRRLRRGRVIEVLVKPGDTVAARAEPDHGRERQGVDGDPVVARRRRQGAQGQGRRQGGEGQRRSRLVEAAARRRPAAAPPPRCRRGAGAPRRAGAAAAAAPRRAPAPAERPVPTAALPAHEPTAPQGALPHASPTIRKLARELGVPLDEVKGSGPKGRITQEDVQGFVKAVMAGSAQTRAQAAQGAAAPAAAAARSPACLPGRRSTSPSSAPIEKKDLSRIKKISGADLHRNWVMIPHVTQPRRRRHHRARGVPRRDQQGEREERASR